MSLCVTLYNAAPNRERMQLDMSMECLRGQHFIDSSGPCRDCRVYSKHGVPGQRHLTTTFCSTCTCSDHPPLSVRDKRASTIVKNILYTTPLLHYTSILSPHFYTTYLYLYSPMIANASTYHYYILCTNCMLQEMNMLSLFTNTLVRY